MNKLRMIAVNDIDSAALSVIDGVELATLPVTNLAEYDNSNTFRSESIADVAIKGVFDTFKLVTGCVLWRHNLSNTAKLRLELFDDEAQQSRVYDSGLIEATPTKSLQDWQWQVEPIVASVFDGWQTRYSQLWLDAQSFALSFKLTIQDPDNADGFIDVTRLYMGRHFEPDYNFSYGHSLGLSSNVEQFRTDDGSLLSPDKPLWRKASFALNYIQDADRAHLSNALRYVNTSKDCFISMFPGLNDQKELEYAFACKFTHIPTIQSITYNLYRSEFAIEEC